MKTKYQIIKLSERKAPIKGLGVKLLKYVLALFLISFSLFSFSQQEELDNYLKIAAENNPGLKAKFNEYMAALEVASQVNSLPDPQVAFAWFISPVETRVGPQRFKVSASQMFPWFGTLQARENVAFQAAKAKYELFEETKSKLFNDVKAAYYNLYFNKKAEEITLENITILATFQKLAEIKIEAGLVSMVDEYRLEMEINELKNQLALLREKEQFLKVVFNNLLDEESNISVLLPENLWTTDFPFSKQAAIDSIAIFNHQLLSIDFQQAAFAYKRDVANLAGKPNIKLGFDYTFIGKGENNLAGKDAFIFPSVGITIPLYRNKYKAMIQEVVYLEAAKTNEKVSKINLLETLFEKGWKNYLDANRRIELYKTQLTLAQKSMHLLETEYITGSKNFEEILRMERKVLKYNLEEEKAKTDKQAAISFINYLMGK
ncbi:MAG: TolC family protein [Prolixibacteraceae bacterium]|jgi:outer membrane protein, heavy metal efflux system|nr:TolC family protein [Prolixibacteraceae bacterium]MBT6007204.1 TolC family protein [Prolixibacteraceae bacterium]MBT6765933.1 TolC family protein [Prolixibacteraceae bacterium]MBT6997708.1 TolC family protein [Prolixibacteraceae bacterium]MBT7394720.1 TolC family protein [Prolixibacteraceae bacterium]